MIERIFYKVGNGLFVLESTGKLINIYDCGSLNKNTIYQAILRMPIIPSNIIDNIFISHYDRDHVNGLLTLFSKYQVRHLILPMIPDLSRVLNCSSATDPFLFDFIADPVGYIENISPDTKVLQIAQSEDSNNLEEYDLGALQHNQILNGGNVKLYVDNWVFIIYNKRVLTFNELVTFMTQLGLTVTASTQDIIKALQKMGHSKTKTTLKNSLKAVFTDDEMKKINEYSMVVWSGPRSMNGGGSLFTGDYDAKKNFSELDLIYKNVMPISQIIQIPHHGSVNNFNINLCKSHCIHVISADDAPYSRQKVDPRKVISVLNTNGFIEQDTIGKDILIDHP